MLSASHTALLVLAAFSSPALGVKMFGHSGIVPSSLPQTDCGRLAGSAHRVALGRLATVAQQLTEGRAQASAVQDALGPAFQAQQGRAIQNPHDMLAPMNVKFKGVPTGSVSSRFGAAAGIVAASGGGVPKSLEFGGGVLTDAQMRRLQIRRALGERMGVQLKQHTDAAKPSNDLSKGFFEDAPELNTTDIAPPTGTSMTYTGAKVVGVPPPLDLNVVEKAWAESGPDWRRSGSVGSTSMGSVWEQSIGSTSSPVFATSDGFPSRPSSLEEDARGMVAPVHGTDSPSPPSSPQEQVREAVRSVPPPIQQVEHVAWPSSPPQGLNLAEVDNVSQQERNYIPNRPEDYDWHPAVTTVYLDFSEKIRDEEISDQILRDIIKAE